MTAKNKMYIWSHEKKERNKKTYKRKDKMGMKKLKWFFFIFLSSISTLSLLIK